MQDDLFGAAADARLAHQGPLAARLRPTALEDVVGQRHLLGVGRPLQHLIDTDRLSSVILWGPPGTGKTTIAQLCAEHTAKHFEQLSAVTATVKDVREVIAAARTRLGERGQGTILFLDEVHRFNKAQQDALLPAVESGVVVLVGATTENPFFEVNPPLLSRSTLFRLEPLDEDAVQTLLERALVLEGGVASQEAIALLVARSGGDGRHALTSLEVALALAEARSEPPTVTLEDAEAALGTKALRYGRDDHYDVISAFIKSVRGSDPDAALHWLARMLEAGEDPRFIARRLVILASEDVGMADSNCLVLADAAARAVEFVGLPEAALNLAHATVHLAMAPKSNRVTSAIAAARDDVRRAAVGEVPLHLRDAHHRGVAAFGHGEGYLYPHDDEAGWIDQQYLPDALVGRRYYEPSAHGHERGLDEVLARRRRDEAQRRGGSSSGRPQQGTER